MRKHPNYKVTDVVKELANTWSQMSKEERQKYKNAAK